MDLGAELGSAPHQGGQTLVEVVHGSVSHAPPNDSVLHCTTLVGRVVVDNLIRKVAVGREAVT